MSELIDRDKPLKLYVQLYEILKAKIENGEWLVGAQISTEDELCKTFDVSKATVRLAILELVRQGFLTRQQGKGTFVCKRVFPQGLMMMTSFREFMGDAGMDFVTEVLAQTVMMPMDDLDVKLNIPEDRHIIYIKRLRSVEGEPLLLQETYMPYPVCPKMIEEDLKNNSIIELLEKKHGVKITRVKDFIEITYLTEEEGRLLGMEQNSPALLLEQQFFSGEMTIMYSRSVKRPERFRFMIEFERKQ